MPPTVNGIFSFLAFFFIFFLSLVPFCVVQAKLFLEAPTFLPQLPNNLSNTGIQMIVCGLQALVQVPQHALHRRIYCRPQKVPHVKGPQIQELVLSQKSRPKQKPGSPNPLWGCLPTPKMELPMTPQGDLSIFPSMLSVLYHSLRGIPSLWGYENIKITALSFISTGPDRCACKEPLVPSTWTKCSSRHLSSLSIMWKVKQDPFFADSRGLHHLYSAAHHWGSKFNSCGGWGFFKVYNHHLAKLWSLILLQRKGSYHTKIQISTKQSFQFSFNIEVISLGSPSSNWDLCWSSLGHPQWQKAGSCHSLFFHWAKPKPFVCSSLSLENLYHPHLLHRW